MKFSRLNILLVIFLVSLNFSSNFLASETDSENADKFVPEATIAESINKATKGTNFNGSVMISQNNGDEYDILYDGAAGTKGGYETDTLYDIGSVSKLYTTTAIMLLQEEGLLSYDDSIANYIDNVPKDKQGITIQMLLTHSSGIYIDENANHSVTKEEELSRILKSKLNFEPGSNFIYSNGGFTLLAAVIESASGVEYEQYLIDNIFSPLGLTSTGFPNSEYLKNQPAINGTLDGVNYGPVNKLDYGWYSKGYTDVVSTPREITYFFQALISGKVVNSDNLKLINSNQIDLGNGRYRGYGAEVRGIDNANKTVGHSGVWYGGNTAVYYRPSDQILFVVTCDELVVGVDLPAIEVYKTISAMYPAATLKNQPIISTEKITSYNDINPKDHLNTRNDVVVDPLSTDELLDTTYEQFMNNLKLVFENSTVSLLVLCIVSITIIVFILIIRRKRWKYLNKTRKKKTL